MQECAPDEGEPRGWLLDSKTQAIESTVTHTWPSLNPSLSWLQPQSKPFSAAVVLVALVGGSEREMVLSA